MKLSSVLKITNAVRIEIIDNKENDFYTFNIDYTQIYGGSASGIDFHETFENHGSKVTLPKRLLTREINDIDVNVAKKAVQIRLK